MKFLMKATGINYQMDVTSIKEAIVKYKEIRNENFLCGSDLLYQVVILDDGKFVNISPNSTYEDMEEYCTEWISSKCPFAKAIRRLGYKGKFRD